MAQMGALFLGMAILIGLIARMGEKRLTTNFVDGARDLLGVALIIGLARGIVVIMEHGLIADTILNSAAQVVGGLPELAFINLMFWIEVAMSFLVPSIVWPCSSVDADHGTPGRFRWGDARSGGDGLSIGQAVW